MLIARVIANLFIVTTLIVIWTMPIAHACPMQGDMSSEVTLNDASPCCPNMDGQGDTPNARCAAMLTCSVQVSKFEMSFKIQPASLATASVSWPKLTVAPLTQFDLVPPGHPPRS